MAFPSAHYYLAWSGTLPGGEVFSQGVRLSPAFTLAGQEAEETACTEYANAIAAWWIAAGNTLVSNRAVLTTVKLNRVGTNGKYVNNYTVREDFASPFKVPPTSGQFPNQVAWVATLETGATRGLAHRGRLFFPIPSATVSSDGLVPSATALTAANNVAGLVNSLNAVRPEARVQVISNGSVSTGAPGVARTVTGVSIGRALDTMRSRRTSVAEQRQVAATTITP